MCKICKQCGEEYTVGNSFHRLCFKCNKIRLRGNVEHKGTSCVTIPKGRIIVRKMIPKISSIRKTEQSKLKHEAVNPYNVDNLKDFFAIIWELRPHVCCHCGCKLGDEPLVHFFSHIYPKSIRPWLKFDPDNIEILCIECHTQHDFGKRKTKL